MVSLASHIHLSRHNIYYYRVVAPKNYGRSSGREIRLSLHTRIISVAKNIAISINPITNSLLIKLSMKKVTWSQLKEILQKEIKEALDYFSTKTQEHGTLDYCDKLAINQHIKRQKENIDLVNKKKLLNISYFDDEGLKKVKALLEEKLSDEVILGEELKEATNAPNQDWIPEHIIDRTKKILVNHDVSLGINDELFSKFCIAAIEADIFIKNKYLEINDNVRDANFTFETPAENSESNVVEKDKIKTTILFSEAVEKFINEKVIGNIWKPKTESQNRIVFKLFVEIFGDIDMNSITSKIALGFKDILLNLPSNRNKKKQYRSLSISQIMSIDIPKSDKLAISKINSYLGGLSSLFTWAVRHGYSPENYFTGLRLKENTSKKDKRLPFTSDHLNKIFNNEIFTESDFHHSYQFWLPLLGLYTGARINELCQLYLSDIKCISNIWVFDINDEKDKELKTLDSKRLVPIHSRLIESGLINYKQYLEKKGEQRLFPELKKYKNTSYAHNAGKWFNERYLVKIGIKARGVVFHCYRHTVIDLYKQQKIEASLIKEIVGHHDGSITTGVYGKAYEPEVLQPLIEQLNFSIESYPFTFKGHNFSFF